MYLRRKQNKDIIKSKIKRNILGWLIMLIPIVLFIFFVWYPILFNIVLSFFNNEKFEHFVGFNNYVAIFKDEVFICALKNTFLYIFWSLIIGFLAPIIIGFLLSECVHAKGFARVCIYLPCMVSGMAVVFLFKSLFGSNSWDVVNVILHNYFGVDKAIDWTSSPKLAIPVIIIAMTWRGAGGTALIYLSNFQQIDNSIYEAARIDGCPPGRRFTRLTLPIMKSTILMLLILQIISVFQVFYEPMVIAGSDNKNAISLMLLAYDYAYVVQNSNNQFQYAKSAATSVILALIILVCTILYFGLTKLLEKKGDNK